ncbi:MAG: Gfo/Idh/MocA family protein [Kordiimonas sp.]
MLRVGIIGYGKMGRIRHKAIDEIGRCQVTHIHDPFDPSLVPTGLNVVEYREILANPDVDAVFICTVNALNKKLTIEALQCGKHVFCEKPPAFCAADVEEIIEVEKRTGKVLMYGFNHRHHSAAQKMKSVATSGKFGRILWMRGRYGKSVDENYLKTWRANAELAGGGILLDQGIHMLDLFLHLGDGFDDVHAFVSNLYWNLEDIEDNVFAILRNSRTGQCASLHSTMTQWRHLFSFEVFMQKGYMVLNGLKTSSQTYGAERLVIAQNRSEAPAAKWQDEEVFEYDSDTSWLHEINMFCDALENRGNTNESDSQSALAVMKLIDKIYENDRHEASQLFNKLNIAE